MVYADELSVAAIVAAVRAGRTVVKLEGPDDPMVELSAGDARIGDTVTARSAELRVRVTGGEGALLYLIENGRRGDPILVDADPFEYARAITAPAGDTDARWRAQLEVDGDPRVVTSHLYVRATGAPPDAGAPDAGAGGSSAGCGCRAAGRSSSGPIFLVAIAALARRLGRQRTAARRSSTM